MNLATSNKFVDFVTSGYKEKCYWEIRNISKDGNAVSFFFDNGEELKKYLEINQGSLSTVNCFFGVNPRIAKTRGDESIKFSNILFTDLDSPKAIEECEKIHSRLNEFRLNPSLIANSGHGVHIYWKISETISSELWTELQKALIEFFKANFPEYNPDGNIKNPERVMRLIGSINVKDVPIETSVLKEENNSIEISTVENILEPFIEEKIIKEVKPQDANLTKELSNEQIEKMMHLVSPLWIKGHRNQMQISLTGTLMKEGFSLNSIRKLIEKICDLTNDEERESRIRNVTHHEKFDDLSQLLGSSGLYKEFLNILEIKEDASQLIAKIKEIASEKPKIKLEFLTNHLNNFQNLEKIVNLYGQEYKVIKKALWYFLFSLPFRRVIIKLGNIEVDGRCNFAFPMPSGSGKRKLVLAIEKIAHEINLEYAKPTSFHPEQLIGKVIRKKEKIVGECFEQVEGWFSLPIVIFEEAIELLRSNEPLYKESRKYLITALDPYGQNELVKKMVDTPIEEALRYTPDMACTMFFQPYSLDEEIVLIGLLRRFIVPYIKVKSNFEVQNYDQRLYGVDENSIINAVNEVSNCIMKLQKENIVVSFKPEAVERLSKLHLEILKMGASSLEKCKNYTLIVDYDLQDKLVKLSAIQALSKGRTVVEAEDVELAFMDLYEFFSCTLNFIENKIIGYLDYGEGWGGAIKKDAEILRWLKEQNAITKDNTKVSISNFISKIVEIYDTSEENARKKYYKFKENGWVDSKQVFQNDTRVWLKVQGDQGNQGGRPMEPSFLENIGLEYQRIVNKLMSDGYTTFTSLTTLKKTE